MRKEIYIIDYIKNYNGVIIYKNLKEKENIIK